MSLSDPYGRPYFSAPQYPGPAQAKKNVPLSKPRLTKSAFGGWFCSSKEATVLGPSPGEAYLKWLNLAPLLVEMRQKSIEEGKKALEAWRYVNAHKP